MNNKQRKTVQQTYEDVIIDICYLMDWLEIELDKTPEEIKCPDVRSVIKVRNDLLEVLSFKSGCDIKALKETLEESRLDRPGCQQPIEKSKESNTYEGMETDLKELEGNIVSLHQNYEQETKKKNFKMAQMYKRDSRDLMDVLNCVNNCNFEQAWNISQSVDTAVREDIPTRLYNFLKKKNGLNN